MRAAPLLCCLLAWELSGCGSAGTSTPIVPVQVFTTIDVPGAANITFEGTLPTDINARGDLVGFYFDQLDVAHSFLRTQDGTLTAFDPPTLLKDRLLGSSAFAINGSGQIAGYYFLPLPIAPPPQNQEFPSVLPVGYLETAPDTFDAIELTIRLVNDEQTWQSVKAYDVNDSGTIAGSVTSFEGTLSGFVQKADLTYTAFVPPGATSAADVTAFACRINAAGAVAGYYWQTGSTFRSFLVAQDGTVTEITAPGLAGTVNTGTLANDINAGGLIAGTVMLGGSTHSFLRAADGTITVFDPPFAGAGGSGASGINDSGVIAGSYIDANTLTHGYIRSVDGTFETVDEPNASQAPNSMGTAIARINANGAIVGVYFDAAGMRHGFVRE